MRLFVALDIDPAIRERISTFMQGLLNFAPDVRWVGPESLHVTLKFIGEWPDERLEELKQPLGKIREAPAKVRFAGTGFFPTVKSARVFWVGIDYGPQLAALAASVDGALSSLGIAKEERPFAPHLTLARSGSGRPTRGPEDRNTARFRRVQEKLLASPPPEFGTMTPREFFLYQSKLSPKGAQYTKIAAFPLMVET